MFPPAEVIAGLLFGLGLKRATKCDPWDPRSGAGASLGIEGFVLGWVVVGFGLAYAVTGGGWRGGGLYWLWVPLGVAGAIAQCFGWYRQGRPIAWTRCVLLAISWSFMAGIAMVLASQVWGWPVYYHGSETSSFDVGREAMTGLLFGAAGATLGVRIRKRALFSRCQSAVRR